MEPIPPAHGHQPMTRLPRNTLLAVLLGIVPALAACAETAPVHQEHAADPAPAEHVAGDMHESHTAHAVIDEALPARRWTPDAPLSRGMQRVRAATATLDHGSHAQLDDAQVRNIAAELKSAVDMMFAGCKLEPEPDAALHPLLARVLVASNTLSESGFDADALAELQAVVARYPLLFDDPTWSASQSD